MSMRISDLDPSVTSGLSTNGTSPASQASAYGQVGQSAYGQTADQVQLSNGSHLAAAAMTDHSARLSQLKASVKSDVYNPPAKAIARSLLREALSRTPLNL